mmetsp:Transcript_20684/g.52778  ORF Transcript_20684/g.52778 Transcript_20684/m.52778 type:complete len:314 (+) Transcript_20684:781-1722(+)
MVPRRQQLARLHNLEAQLPILFRALVVHVPRGSYAGVFVELLDAQDVRDALHGPRAEARDDREVELVYAWDVFLLLGRERREEPLLCLRALDRRPQQRLPALRAAAGAIPGVWSVQLLQHDADSPAARLVRGTGEADRAQCLVDLRADRLGAEVRGGDLGAGHQLQVRVWLDRLHKLRTALAQRALRQHCAVERQQVEQDHAHCRRLGTRHGLALPVRRRHVLLVLRVWLSGLRRLAPLAQHHLQDAAAHAAQVAVERGVDAVEKVAACALVLREHMRDLAIIHVHLRVLALQEPVYRDGALAEPLERGGHVV